MKTILQLAKELEMPKQKLYRHIKKYIIDVHQENGVMYLSDAAEHKLKCALDTNEPHQETTSDALHYVHHDTVNDMVMMQLYQTTIDMLKMQIEQKDRQLEEKDRQIAELIELQRNQQILLKQEQDRHQGNFWQRLFLPSKTVR